MKTTLIFGALALLLFAGWARRTVLNSRCPLTLAKTYTLCISQDDAKELGDNVSETYMVMKKTASQVDLVCKVKKSSWLTTSKWATITISFNPSTGAPYYGTCIEIDENGLIDRGKIKLTPVGAGFDFEYWEESPPQFTRGQIQPNWY